MTDQSAASGNPLARRLFFGAGLAAAVTGTTMLRPDPADAATSASTPWKLGGNAGTSSSKDYLGTADAKDLVIRTNKTERIRITRKGRVGIGTTTPGTTLDVAGDATVSGILTTNYGLYANGITGVTASGSDSGVFGTGTGSDGVGVLGSSSGSNGKGIYGISPAFAVYAETGSGSYGYGVRGNGYFGVYGTTSTGFGLYSDGRAHVNGTLSKSAGTFLIDHPLDPDRMWLRHSFVESPDMMNVYNGNVVLDDDGAARVELPAYFTALNRDYRYQLTCIGGHAPVYIAQKMADNAFTIGGGTPGLEVSWQVTGIRQDDYAKAHPIVVEERKTGPEDGARAFVPKGSNARAIDHRALAGIT